MVEDVARLTIFHRASGVHHQHLIADPGDDAEIVGNHNDRRIELALELIKQCHYLRLHGYVQRRCRLIGNQQLRPAQQRHRNHDALAHPAGKLVRIHFHPFARLGHFDRIQHFHRLFKGFGFAQRFMQHQDFHQLFAYPHIRIKRRHRILKNH